MGDAETANDYERLLSAVREALGWDADRGRMSQGEEDMLAGIRHLRQGSIALSFEARPAAAAVVRTPGACGGAARADGTRIPVWQLVEERGQGASDARLLADYPSLTARALAAAWDYADAHPDEIAAEARRNAAPGRSAGTPDGPRPFAGYDRERAAYALKKPALLEEAAGKFVVFVGDEMAGPFGTSEDALRAGWERFGPGPLYVKQVLADEPVIEAPRGVTPCP